MNVNELGLYLHLARAYWRRKQMSDRDRLLILSGVTAAALDLPLIAAYCRHLILENNQGHMIRKWPSFEFAVQDSEFETFLKQVRRKYPIERVETVLSEFGIELANERATYYRDDEYAAAILDVDLEWLADRFNSADR